MWLKQSTAVTVTMGPFVDKDDAVTAYTTIIPASAVNVAKNGAASTGKSDTSAGIHDTDGHHRFNLNVNDTGTLGRLRVHVSNAAAYLPIWQDFEVVPANVWDSYFGADRLEVDVQEWESSAGAVKVGGTTGLPEMQVAAMADTAITPNAGSNWEVFFANGAGASTAVVGSIDATISSRATQTSVDGKASQTSVDDVKTDTAAIKVTTDKFTFNAGSVDANVDVWQGVAISGTNMIQDPTTTPKWTAAALSLAPSGGSGFWTQTDVEQMRHRNGLSGTKTDPGAVTASLWSVDVTTLIEDSAGLRYTAKALEQAPSGGGGGLTEQQVRDAMKLAPTAGTPAAGSVDTHLDDIQAQTDQMGFTGSNINANAQVVSDKTGYSGTVTGGSVDTVGTVTGNVNGSVNSVIQTVSINANDILGASLANAVPADNNDTPTLEEVLQGIWRIETETAYNAIDSTSASGTIRAPSGATSFTLGLTLDGTTGEVIDKTRNG